MEKLTSIQVAGAGAVSPAGWGVAALRDALEKGIPLKTQPLTGPGSEAGQPVRLVPPSDSGPRRAARTRRASAITDYAVAAAFEAADNITRTVASERCGMVLCVTNGCVQYTRRFWAEVLQAPGQASPIVFPETVFNAPSSHIGSLLGMNGLNYTLVGDSAVFLSGLAIAAMWLEDNLVDACLVVGTEEVDWTTANAYRLFARKIIVSEGAGALLLQRAAKTGDGVALAGLTAPHSFGDRAGQRRAALAMREELRSLEARALLCAGWQNQPRIDQSERDAWHDWSGPMVAPKAILGDGLAASAAWQCVVAVDHLRRQEFDTAAVSAVGCNQQAMGALFQR